MTSGRCSVVVLLVVMGCCLIVDRAVAAAEPPADVVTFNRDVAPVIFAHCSGCHHPGEAAPFSLLTYEDVCRRAKQVVEVTHLGFMPPWLPKAGAVEFVGERRLSDRERQMLARWLNAGTPRGEPKDLPPAPTFVEGWQTGTPDLVLESPEYRLAAQDKDVFRNFVVPVPLVEPRWVQSIELRPTNPRVTHHARLGVDSSNESVRRDAQDPEPGYAGMAWAQDPDGQLVIWAPGVVASAGTPGIAWRLFPRSVLVLHTHMQPSGKPEAVKFRIGIHFAKEPPTQRPLMMRVGSCDIDIPAGVKHHVVTDSYTLPVDVDVAAIFPHAHSLCTALRVSAELPTGATQPLITIEHFDENWHDAYRYRNPVRLPRGTRLVSTFAYDNTDENVRNRNHPARRVVYGSNVTDEMADVYLTVTPVRPDQRAALAEDYRRYALRSEITGHKKSLELYLDNPWSLEGLATCYVGTGEFARAISTLQQRLQTGPAEVYPVVGLGMARLSSGDTTSAETELRRGIAMDAEYPLAWFGLAKTLLAQQKSEPAEQAFRRTIELAPGLSDARLGLAELLVQRRRLDEAERECVAALDNSPDPAAVHLKLGEISAKRKNYDQALEHFTRAREAAPYTHPPKVLLAVSCTSDGDTERGVSLLRQSRTEEPSYPVTPLLLGQLAARQQQWPAAREQFAAAAALPIPDNWPESHRRRFLVLLHSERFRLAQQLQDLPLAKDSLAKWIEAEPENQKLRQMYEAVRAEEGR